MGRRVPGVDSTRAAMPGLRRTAWATYYRVGMNEPTCPQCGSEMASRSRGGVTLSQCTACQGIFLARADLGLLIEQENEWHLSSGPTTQPIPRIVPGMTPPPDYVPAKQSRSYLDELFG